MRLRAALALLLASASSAPAFAQEPDEDVLDPEGQVEAARRAFVAGTEAYEAGLFEEALANFRRAYRLTGTPDVLYNIARAADRLDRNAEALEAYERYLDMRPDAEDRGHIEDRILSLRAILEPDAEPPTPQDVEEPPDHRPPDPEPDPEPAPEPPADEGPGAGPWLLAGSGVAAAAAGTVAFVLTESVLGLVGAGLGGALVVGGVIWAVSF